jgi:hypothetical protein
VEIKAHFDVVVTEIGGKTMEFFFCVLINQSCAPTFERVFTVNKIFGCHPIDAKDEEVLGSSYNFTNMNKEHRQSHLSRQYKSHAHAKLVRTTRPSYQL